MEKNKQAIALEELSLAWTELLSDWHETWSAQGVSFESCVTAANLNEYMKDSAKIDSVTNNNENGTYTIVYKANDNEGNIYTFIANENGKIELSNGIIISPSNLELELVRNGETVTKTPKTIRASLTNVDGQVTWSVTSGAGVVSLSNTTGTAIEVTPEAGGQATITASNQDGTISKSVEVTVNVPVTRISITPTTAITMAPDGTATLTATVEPSDATNKNVTWSITPNDLSKASIVGAGNTEVASIAGTSGGAVTVKGKADGTATVTVTSVSDGSITASKTITVGEVLGHFKTLKDNVANKWKAYYFPGDTDDNPIEITNNPSDAGYLGNFLGMKVDYTRSGTAIKSKNRSDAVVSVGKSTTYRLFYIDVGGNYGTEGTIYLKADADTNYGSLDDLDALPSGKTSVIKSSLNRTWINSSYASSPATNMTYVNKLLDATLWEPYKDSSTTRIANYVIGAPSLEMWIDAYNVFLAKYPVAGYDSYNCTVTQDTTTAISATDTTKKGPVGANNGKGYYVGHGGNYTENSGWYIDSSTLVKPSSYTSSWGTGYAVPADRVKAYNSGSDYWLASPSAGNSSSVMFVYGNNSSVGNNLYFYTYAFCPLVSCNSGVNINQKK